MFRKLAVALALTLSALGAVSTAGPADASSPSTIYTKTLGAFPGGTPGACPFDAEYRYNASGVPEARVRATAQPSGVTCKVLMISVLILSWEGPWVGGPENTNGGAGWTDTAWHYDRSTYPAASYPLYGLITQIQRIDQATGCVWTSSWTVTDDTSGSGQVYDSSYVC